MEALNKQPKFNVQENATMDLYVLMQIARITYKLASQYMNAMIFISKFN